MINKLLLKQRINPWPHGPTVLNRPIFPLMTSIYPTNKGGYSFALPDIKLKCRTLKHFYLHEYFARVDQLNVFQYFCRC